MRDAEITERPPRAIDRVEEALPKLSPTERQKNVEHVKAYAEIYYKGRHDVDVPREVRERIENLSKRVQRLKDVDIARATVAKFGGPPSERTIQESLARSAAELQQQQRVAGETKAGRNGVRAIRTEPKPAAKGQEQQIGMGM